MLLTLTMGDTHTHRPRVRGEETCSAPRASSFPPGAYTQMLIDFSLPS